MLARLVNDVIPQRFRDVIVFISHDDFCLEINYDLQTSTEINVYKIIATVQHKLPYYIKSIPIFKSILVAVDL